MNVLFHFFHLIVLFLFSIFLPFFVLFFNKVTNSLVFIFEKLQYLNFDFFETLCLFFFEFLLSCLEIGCLYLIIDFFLFGYYRSRSLAYKANIGIWRVFKCASWAIPLHATTFLIHLFLCFFLNFLFHFFHKFFFY